MRGPASGAPCAARLLSLAILVTTALCASLNAREPKQQLIVCQNRDKVCSTWPQLHHELRNLMLSSGQICGQALGDPLKTIEGLDFILIRKASGEVQYLQCKSVQFRFRRQAPGYGSRGKYRGQTQSQYLSVDHGNGGDDGKAEAHSAADSSHATVSGKSGMGQAQSQSMYDPSCDDCLSRSDTGVENLRHPGQSGPGSLAGQDNNQGIIGVPGSRPSIGAGTPGWNGYPGQSTIGNQPFGNKYSPGGAGQSQPSFPGVQGQIGKYPGATGQGQQRIPGGQGQYPSGPGQGQPGIPGGQGHTGQYPVGSTQDHSSTSPGGTGQYIPEQYPGANGQGKPRPYPGGIGQGLPNQFPNGIGQNGQNPERTGLGPSVQYPGGTGQGKPGQNQGGTDQSNPGQYPVGIDHRGTFPGQNRPGQIPGVADPQRPQGSQNMGQQQPGGIGQTLIGSPGIVNKDQPGQMVLPNTGYGHNGINQVGGPYPGGTGGGRGQEGYYSGNVPNDSGKYGGNIVGPYGQPVGNIPQTSSRDVNGPNYGQQPTGPRGTIIPGSEGLYQPFGVNQGTGPRGPISTGPSGYIPGSGSPGTNQYASQPGTNKYGSQNGVVSTGLVPFGQGNLPQSGTPGSLVGTHIGPNGETIYCCVVSPGQGSVGPSRAPTASDQSRPGFVYPTGIAGQPYLPTSGGSQPISQVPGEQNSYGPGSTGRGQQNFDKQTPGVQQQYIPGTGPTYTPGSPIPGGQQYNPGYGHGPIGAEQQPGASVVNGANRPYYNGGGDRLYSPGQGNIGQPDTSQTRGSQGSPGTQSGYTPGQPYDLNINQSPGYQNGHGPGLRPSDGSSNGQPFQYGPGPTGLHESYPGVDQGNRDSNGPITAPGGFPGSQTYNPDQHVGQISPQGPGYSGQVPPSELNGQNAYPQPGTLNQGRFPGQTGYPGQTTNVGYPSGYNYPAQGGYPGQTSLPGQTNQLGVPDSRYPDGQHGQTRFPGQINQGQSGYPGQTGNGFPGQTNNGGIQSQPGYPGQTGIPGGLPNQGNLFQPENTGNQGNQAPYDSNYRGTVQNTPNVGGNWPQGGQQAGPDSNGGYGQVPYGSQHGYSPGSGVPGSQTEITGVPGQSTDYNGVPQNVIDPNSIPMSLDDDSDALASVAQDTNGTIASASSKGGNSKGRAQTQVQGTYTGTGTFSAQAQINDETKGAESQVSGGKQGASSSALGRGRNNKSQANVQLGAETGSLQTQAQSEGSSHSSNTQVQGSVKGGMADAQARGPGSTSSQAQIGFTPYKEGDKAHDAQKIPFVGAGTASSQSTGRIGQSQSQLQGTFKYGISYNGAAQAGSSVDREAVFPNRLPFNKIDVFDEKNKNIDTNPEPTPISTSTPEGSSSANIVNDKEDPWDSTNSHSHSDHHKIDQPTKGKANTPTPVDGRKSAGSETSIDYAEKEEIPEEYDAEDYDPEINEEQYEPDEAISEPADASPSLQSTKRKSLDIKQTIGGNTQHIVLDPLHNQDAEITQKHSERPDYRRVYQPGDKVPGTGYTIPQGFTGSVEAVSSRDKTYAFGSDASPSQAQTVAIRPGSGKVNYMYPSGASTTSFGKNVNSENLKSLSNSKPNNNYLSVSKSVTGALDGDNNIKKQYSHTYYTKASSCGYFTFTCNVVTGPNGRKKVCKPKIPTNPDGTPMKC